MAEDSAIPMTAPGRTAYEDEMRNGLPEALRAQLLPGAENLAVALTEAVLADGLGFKGPFEEFGRIAEPLLLDALGAARRDGAQVANEASAQALARLRADLTAAEAEIASLRLRVGELEQGAPASPSGHSRAEPFGLGASPERPSRISAAHLEGPWPRRPKPGQHPDGAQMHYDIPWIKDWREITGRTLKEGMEAHQLALHGQLAEGCCSAISPCSHQQRDPYSLCLTCRGVKDRADASTIEARQGQDLGLDALHESPTPQGGMPALTTAVPASTGQEGCDALSSSDPEK